MVASVKRILISGYYGFKNSGDEAVLQSIILALQSEANQQGVEIEPIVLSIDPEWTETVFGVRAVHRLKFREVLRAIRHCDGLISGGGSLMQDVTGIKSIPYYLGVLKLAQWLRKPTFIYAQGIGPIQRPIFQKLLKRVFRKCRYISVRDQDSADFLMQMGLRRERIEVVPDPVMGLPLQAASSAPTVMSRPSGALELSVEDELPGTAEPSGMPKTMGSVKARKPIIGVSVRFWHPKHAELDMLSECLYIVQSLREVSIRLLPFYPPADRQASMEIIDNLRRRQLRQPNTGFRVTLIDDCIHPQQMLAQVQACDLIIGMRLHALIFAASQFVPVIGISYDPKIDLFLAQLGLEATATTSHFNPHKVADAVLEILDMNNNQWMESKRPLIEPLKANATRPAQRITNYFAAKQHR